MCLVITKMISIDALFFWLYGLVVTVQCKDIFLYEVWHKFRGTDNVFTVVHVEDVF